MSPNRTEPLKVMLPIKPELSNTCPSRVFIVSKRATTP